MDKKYEKIIDMTYPFDRYEELNRPKIPVNERAKIFAPFAALKGYKEALEEQDDIFKEGK